MRPVLHYASSSLNYEKKKYCTHLPSHPLCLLRLCIKAPVIHGWQKMISTI